MREAAFARDPDALPTAASHPRRLDRVPLRAGVTFVHPWQPIATSPPLSAAEPLFTCATRASSARASVRGLIDATSARGLLPPSHRRSPQSRRCRRQCLAAKCGGMMVARRWSQVWYVLNPNQGEKLFQLLLTSYVSCCAGELNRC